MWKIIHYAIIRIMITAILFTVSSTIFCDPSYSSEDLQPGSRYKIIKPLYLMAVSDNLDHGKISKETARAYLHSKEYYKKHFVAFQCEVPVDTIMTIIGPAPKVWNLPFLANCYYVRLDPDPSRGLDIELELNRGIEGSLDGLNPKLFERLE